MELWREFAVAKEARRERYMRDVTIAWHVAVFSRQKTLQSLAQVLRPLQTWQRRQTPSEQRHVLQVLSNQLGVPLQIRQRA